MGKGENNMSIGNSNVLYNTKNTIGGGQEIVYQIV